MHDTIIAYIQNELVGDPGLDLNPDDDLLASGLVSSMAIFRLISFLEAEFSIRIPPEEMTIDHFVSVRAMAAYVEQRQSLART